MWPGEYALEDVPYNLNLKLVNEVSGTDDHHYYNKLVGSPDINGPHKMQTQRMKGDTSDIELIEVPVTARSGASDNKGPKLQPPRAMKIKNVGRKVESDKGNRSILEEKEKRQVTEIARKGNKSGLARQLKEASSSDSLYKYVPIGTTKRHYIGTGSHTKNEGTGWGFF
ncbi:hypothetical protein V6N13_087781 [Hibiscus sabdariffa]|uniref:Uncharacterized protein n=1 Tax=Hibiscus sabdariffa TaxID=183260 RepID=A0ABR2FXF4_9ROSI